ncbi:MAG: M23 family metallopeptidase [Peptococcaceae bacterium]|nr:M23 family metallopeptidase [Peptococcaceae bacterium]
MNPLDKWDDWEWERAAQELARAQENPKTGSRNARGDDYEDYGGFSSVRRNRGSNDNGGFFGGGGFFGNRNNRYSWGNSGFVNNRYAKSGRGSINMNLLKWTGSQRRVAVAAVFFLLILFSSYGADKLSLTVYNAYQRSMGSDSYPVISNMITDALGLTGGEALPVDGQSRVFYPPVAGAVKVAFKAKDDRGKTSQGVWIGSSLGTTVYSPGTGVVMEVGTDEIMGHYVRVKLDDGWESVIGNLGDIWVVKGDPVQKGGVLGTVGTSASHRNPWIYLELRKNGKAMDPLVYLLQGEAA